MICLGDCNGDGVVTIDEIIVMVNIDLDNQPISACPSGTNGSVTVADIIMAVNNALDGCGHTGQRLNALPAHYGFRR